MVKHNLKCEESGNLDDSLSIDKIMGPIVKLNKKVFFFLSFEKNFLIKQKK